MPSAAPPPQGNARRFMFHRGYAAYSPAMLNVRSIAIALCTLTAAMSAFATQGVVLPAWVCAYPDAIFDGGFDAGEMAILRNPSQGSAGAYPGNITRQVAVAGLGSQTYYAYLPGSYTPNHAWPLMLALHGSGGAGTSDMYAQQVRSDWSALADAQGFIIAAPVGTDSQGGGWNAPDANGHGPSDYDLIAAAIADTEQAYNVERSRVYAWGYSAGGEVLHDIVLTGWSGLNADTFAGYAVTGAALAGCPTYNSVQSCKPADAARIIPLDVHIGSVDPIVAHGYASSDRTAFLTAGWNLGTTLFFIVFSDGDPPGGHIYTEGHLQQVWSNLCPNAVAP
jgi:predicted esterase